MNSYRWLLVLLCILLLNQAGAQIKKPAKQVGYTDPEQSFLSPPPAAKPGVLWMWMGANLSKAGIRKDLEALKAEGFNRTTMFSLADVTTPWAGSIGNSPTPNLISWTEPWWKMVRFAAQESKRLGMDFGMYNGPGYESSGGPWVSPEQSMQEVCWSATPVSGNSHVNIKLSRPTVKLRGHTPWPIHNPETGIAEIPDVPARQTYYKDITVLAMPGKGTVLTSQVIDLSKKMQADGSLTWDAPAGNWIIYRFGHTTSGTLIQPAQWQATGLECDKMSQQAIDFHLNHVIGEIQKHIGDLIGTGFTHLHFDSYEAGTPTWTPLMPQEFLKRRGYSVMPYMAMFAGRVVCDSKADSLKFTKDFDATVKDLYRDIYFKTIVKKVHAAHLSFLCEPYGGPWRQDEIMPMVDKVMTEFWTHGGKYSPYELEPTVTALRKSGQNIVEAEAFTGDPRDSKWDETPAWIKPMGDAAFCEGVNRFIVHRFVQQPWDDKYLPGLTMGQWGTHFDRTQTWWKPGKALVDYWQRCQALLQWGRIAKPDKDDVKIAGAQAGSALKAIHRTDGATNIYFVANTSHQPISASCSFKVSGMQPEIWDPVTKTRRDLTNFESDLNGTTVNLDFDDAQSFFIVFRKKPVALATRKSNFSSKQKVQEISGRWNVQFDPKWGGPAQPVTFANLQDWTTSAQPGIKYFSGTAVYTKTFGVTDDVVNASEKGYYLDLGNVKHLARVKINGTDLGVVWTAPWGVHIPAGLLKTKGNKLMIEVTNVWANRLIGDEQEPADCEWLHGQWGGDYLKEFPQWFVDNKPRPSSGRYCFTTWNYFTKDSPLISSGLLGPVVLTKENYTTL